MDGQTGPKGNVVSFHCKFYRRFRYYIERAYVKCKMYSIKLDLLIAF